MLPTKKRKFPPKNKMIISYLGKDFKEYFENALKINEKKWICPKCHSRAHIHGTYLRSIVDAETEEIKKVVISRIKCSSEKCGKTHAIIPDFLCPKKRYTSKEIGESIEIFEEKGSVKEVKAIAEESTIKRWIKQYLGKINKIINELEKMLLKDCDKQISLTDFKEKGLKRIRLIKEKYKQINHSNIIGFTNQLLSLNGLNIFL